MRVHNGDLLDGQLYAIQLRGEEGWSEARFCNGCWISGGSSAFVVGAVSQWVGPVDPVAAGWGGLQGPTNVGASYAIWLPYRGWVHARWDLAPGKLSGAAWHVDRKGIVDLLPATAVDRWIGPLLAEPAAALSTPGQVIGGGHASGCAVNNEPAYPAGPCTCGAAWPAAVIASPLSDLDREALMREPPGRIEAMAPVGPAVEWRHGAFNPEPQEGLDYWVWLTALGRAGWMPARYQAAAWWPTMEVESAINPKAVKLWRGPMACPPAPTPAEVDAVLGPRRAVHDASDLETTG